jgi:hypothetical protein
MLYLSFTSGSNAMHEVASALVRNVLRLAVMRVGNRRNPSAGGQHSLARMVMEA